ncbi:Sensor protein ZraS [Hartmannibacter diazotrophicus]|uniref:histidine kinase n=1 Tax=Hartmannibacter diazotrophicus TaxID=1482074 RepID=A0A2C9D146_9HYPH|nr:ATP-binding protein [Hartmannibacter diazotrophicus]SON53966.1 Sensor protein ZraS [Hartmannibacter diazotrophicus]
MIERTSLEPSLLMESAWMDVIQKMDETYADLLAYQVELEKKNADLESMRQFMDSVLGAMTDILIVCDQTGRVLQINRAVELQLGRDQATVEGSAIQDLFTGASAAPLQDMLKLAAKRKTVGARELCLAGLNGDIPIEVHAAPRLDARGRVVGVVLIGRPVGEVKRAYASLNDAHEQLKAAQAQLVHSEKMASLGRLVSGVAHELNNPISFVYGNAHALERYVGRLEAYFQKVWSGAPREELIELREDLNVDRAVSRMREAISGALEGAERVRDIVESLRRFSADGRGQSERFDLVQAVQTAIGWVIKGRDRHFTLHADVPERLEITGRSGHIQQVVMNIVQNACDSIEGQAEQVVSVTIRQDGEDAVITIADNGPGIAEEARTKLFEPFFTTKPVGKGTGLGLSISYKIIEEHGGHLSAGNGEDGGAVFTIRLPLSGPQSAPAGEDIPT